MEEIIPCAVKDQEVFQQVWQRVMAGRDDTQCPIEALPAHMQGDLSCDCLEALAQQHREGRERQQQESVPDVPPSGWQPAEVESPAPESPPEESPAPGAAEALPTADGPHRANDLPRLWEQPQETPDRTARLRQQVMEALEGWQFYRHLARRARGVDARVLNNLAGELHRCARKLSAAYFLLTGLRYWPSELLAAPAIPSYWGALRQRHQAEQRQDTALRIAADDWDDPDLLALLTELIEGCQQRCRQLRTLLEQDET